MTDQTKCLVKIIKNEAAGPFGPAGFGGLYLFLG